MIAIFVGHRTHRAGIEREAAKAVFDHGGSIFYGFQYDSSGIYAASNTDGVPDWLVETFGQEYFHRIYSAIGWPEKLTDDHLTKLSRLGRLDAISYNHFKTGTLTGSVFFTNDAINRENEFDPPRVDPGGAGISDRGVCSLSDCRSLTAIYLYGEQITDDGVAALTRLPNLEYLNLGSTQITDKSIEHFAKMKSLQSLGVSGTWISRPGVEELRRRLPDCQVTDQREFKKAAWRQPNESR